MIKLINVENKIDVAEFAKVLQAQRVGTACECLSLIKSMHQKNDPLGLSDWRYSPGVQEILNLYCINSNIIR